MVRLIVEEVLSSPFGCWDSEAMIVEIRSSWMETTRRTGCAEEPEPIGHLAHAWPFRHDALRVNGQSSAIFPQ